MIRLVICIAFAVSIRPGQAEIIAISYFDNNSGIARYNPLSKGIADMLITPRIPLRAERPIGGLKLIALLGCCAVPVKHRPFHRWRHVAPRIFKH